MVNVDEKEVHTSMLARSFLPFTENHANITHPCGTHHLLLLRDQNPFKDGNRNRNFCIECNDRPIFHILSIIKSTNYNAVA